MGAADPRDLSRSGPVGTFTLTPKSRGLKRPPQMEGRKERGSSGGLGMLLWSEPAEWRQSVLHLDRVFVSVHLWAFVVETTKQYLVCLCVGGFRRTPVAAMQKSS